MTDLIKKAFKYTIGQIKEDIMKVSWFTRIVSLLMVLLSVVGIFGLFQLSACATTSQGVAEVNFENGELFLDDYIKYIQNDEKLDEFNKKSRVDSVEAWKKLLKEVLEESKKNKEGSEK